MRVSRAAAATHHVGLSRHLRTSAEASQEASVPLRIERRPATPREVRSRMEVNGRGDRSGS